MAAVIVPPDQAGLLGPILPALPAAAASTQPATQVLPLLSPILRQRVQILSSSSTEPWLRLLCYDASKSSQLADVARGPALEPHPVSGEVEVDWGYDAETRYRRLDKETLQALVALPHLGLAFRLVYCINDSDRGGDGDGDGDGGGGGWRIGEVTVTDEPSPFSTFGGASTIAEAERQYRHSQGSRDALPVNGGSAAKSVRQEEEDDNDYWARYDATPARTPAQSRSPAAGTNGNTSATLLQTLDSFKSTSADDDGYFAQYDNVQPAMDNHDPDEEAHAAPFMPPLGLCQNAASPRATAAAAAAAVASATNHSLQAGGIYPGMSNTDMALEHPRPHSSASSSRSNTVARLEETAGKQEQNEFGVKQHVSRSIRSLYMLSKASGIDRDEFERLVQTELQLLGMMDDGD
ncbi:uncharacterized protein UV8b_02604 [Ustilaginoidea virens]|uniref:Uncharacterized protein n=1 Tax=Ustilaginoidea virens TaxID=1159556 RepID=A0A8E5MFF9_USTVR|nr:uncharacterized protein UV8b_02604 [Ustilaginoidea virens]QUC18363.1 hypothetical protein UV8b_02604 [Ustilaginoidea virens]